MELTPLCTWRDAHGERHAGSDPHVVRTSAGFAFEHAYRVVAPGWEPDGGRYRGAHLRAEAERGLPADEDLWACGLFSATLRAGDSLDVVASAVQDGALSPASDIVDRLRRRASKIVATAHVADAAEAILVLAADQFVVGADQIIEHHVAETATASRSITPTGCSARVPSAQN